MEDGGGSGGQTSSGSESLGTGKGSVRILQQRQSVNSQAVRQAEGIAELSGAGSRTQVRRHKDSELGLLGDGWRKD